MKCTQCGSLISPMSSKCRDCGLPTVPQADELERQLQQMQRELDEQLAETSANIEQSLVQLQRELSFGTAIPPASTAHVPASDRHGASDLGANKPYRELLHPIEINALYQPQLPRVMEACSAVFNSMFVQTNALYSQRTATVGFVFEEGSPVINAYATDRDIKSGELLKSPRIVYFHGLATAIRLAAVAVALHFRALRDKGNVDQTILRDTLTALGECISRNQGSITVQDSLAIFQSLLLPKIDGDESFASPARSYAMGMDMFVIAHELGHICLGHTLGMAVNYDISRNQERQADSFAASLLSSSAFRESLFLGNLFVTLIFAWLEARTSNNKVSTHPMSRERFIDAIRSNSEAAREACSNLRMTEEQLLKLLP
jgi:hypothetical protein